MNLTGIFVLFALNAIAEGTFWATAARSLTQPILLSFGAAFAAIKGGMTSNDDDEVMDWDREEYYDNFGRFIPRNIEEDFIE